MAAKYLKLGRDEGPHFLDGRCLRCGKPLGPNPVMLNLDQRVNEYHDFGGIPDERNQGGFQFGHDCADIMRERARAALAKGRSSDEH